MTINRDKYPAYALELYTAHRRVLVKLAESIIGCPAQAEDIVHEAFVRLSRQPEGQVKAPLRYATTVVRNLSIDTYRHQRREGAVLSFVGSTSDLGDVKSSEPDVEHAVSIKQEYQRFLTAADKLPYQTRRALILYAVEQRTTREVAGELEVSLTKAHLLIKEGMAHCRKHILAGDE